MEPLTINSYTSTSAITAEQIHEAMERVRTTGRPASLRTNPCSEIILGQTRVDNNSFISGAAIISGNITMTGRTRNYKADYDEDTLTVEVPGVSKDEIEVFTQKGVLFIKVREESPITYVITDEQTVRSVKLDLGILTIIIDNSEKRQLLEID